MIGINMRQQMYEWVRSQSGMEKPLSVDWRCVEDFPDVRSHDQLVDASKSLGTFKEGHYFGREQIHFSMQKYRVTSDNGTSEIALFFTTPKFDCMGNRVSGLPFLVMGSDDATSEQASKLVMGLREALSDYNPSQRPS